MEYVTPAKAGVQGQALRIRRSGFPLFELVKSRRKLSQGEDRGERNPCCREGSSRSPEKISEVPSLATPYRAVSAAPLRPGDRHRDGGVLLLQSGPGDGPRRFPHLAPSPA